MANVKGLAKLAAATVYEANGKRIHFSPDEVIWIPRPNPIDEFSGLAPLASARLGLTAKLDLVATVAEMLFVPATDLGVPVPGTVELNLADFLR